MCVALYLSRNVPRVVQAAGDDHHIDFTRFPPQHFVSTFRVDSLKTITRLAVALRLPEVVRVGPGYVAERSEALAVTLGCGE